jgi:putative ABC transport system ATP-binding protein
MRVAGAEAPDWVFQARQLSKTYGQGAACVHALREANFEIRRGEFIVLLGPSGSGKSTLLNLLGGLDTASSGTVQWQGLDLTQADERALTQYRRLHVGFVFQFYNLISSLTARENVQLATDLIEHPLAPEDALALVGLQDRMDHFPAQLSGGEQQRVAIARAIAKKPACLLCDEPTGALDVTTGRQVLAAIALANRDLGTTTLVITHNATIAQMADRIMHLKDGRIDVVETNPHKLTADLLSW